MSISVLYEDFSDLTVSPLKPQQSQPIAETATEDMNRASFDDGYKEGWIDAQAAAQSETKELNTEVATALQEAGFAYFEARQHIFKSMRPLLEAIVEQVVPEMARESIALKVVEQLEQIAEQTEPPMHVLCAPATALKLNDVLEKHVSFPVEVREEATLAETQAVLKFSEGQTNIDLSSVVDGLKSAISDFYELNYQEETRSHG
jgi:flagellar biosynthesis/type III secretory pathway protein FliH